MRPGRRSRLRRGKTRRTPAALLLVIAVAVPLLVAVAGLPAQGSADAPIHTHVGARYVADGVAETGMTNLVAAVLLNYRGFDTFVEVVVIFTALVAVLALPRGAAPAGAGPAGAGHMPAGSAAVGPAVEPRAAPTVPVSPVVRFVVRLLAPFVALFALAMLFQGHVTPGGGFQAAALFAALFIALALVLGSPRAERWIPVGLQPWLQAVGPLGFALVAWIGARLTGSFLGVPVDDHAAQEGLGILLEVAIAVGGGVVLARLFLTMER